MPSHRDRLLAAANGALEGSVPDIVIKRAGSVAILNAAKDLAFTGYSPEAELLKGLIVRLDADVRAVDLVAGCLPKFYNWTEAAESDGAFLAALAAPGARLVAAEKLDGTNVRGWVDPATGEVRFATRGNLVADASRGVDYSGIAAAIAARRYPSLLDPGLASTLTVVCELIHPDTHVITDYGDREDLVVVAAIELASGRELGRDELVALVEQNGLTLAPVVPTTGDRFEDVVAALRERWVGTDTEGAVLAVEVPGAPVPARLKVKGTDYLSLLYRARHCTLRQTVGFSNHARTLAWEPVRAAILAAHPRLSEELLMGYREHLDTYVAMLAAEADAILARYLVHPARGLDDQRAFAAAIDRDPDGWAFFVARRDERQGGGLDAARDRIIESLRRRGLAFLGAAADPEPDEDA